jgi:hypothetical protein
MKKTIFVMFFLLAISILPGMAYAKSGGEYQAALKSYYSGKYKDAVLHLKVCISQKPEPAAYYLMGYSLYKLKRFDEANEYFSEAYLIDPAFTPVNAESDHVKRRRPEKKAAIADAGEAMAGQKEIQQPKPGAQKPAVEIQPDKKPAMPHTQAQPVEAKKVEPPKPEPPKPEPQKTEAQKAETSGTVSPAIPSVPAPQPSVPRPQLPKPKQSLPEGAGGLIAIPLLMGGLFAGFALVIFGILLAFYVFFSLCMYLIAKKLNVPAAWTAWVPLLNLWALVGSAGKPWWWILLLFVPLLNFFVGIYLWMCIVENLGKNRWLGLLIFVPLVGMIYMAILAFSKDNAPARSKSELE